MGIYIYIIIYIYMWLIVVGGFKHEFYFPFSRWLKPPTRYNLMGAFFWLQWMFDGWDLAKELGLDRIRWNLS